MTVATAKPLQGPRFYASQRGSRIQVVLKKKRRWLGVSLNFAKNTASEIKEFNSRQAAEAWVEGTTDENL